LVSQQAPTTARQVHVRQIIVTEADLAQTILTQLEAGASFIDLALEYSTDAASRANGGDLGWFPQGVGVVPPTVEALVFALAPGEYSPIIAVEGVYYLMKLENKRDNQPLTPQQRQQMQHYFFDQWLAQQQASAQIERYLN